MYTIRFEDHGQDFSQWDISHGVVVDSRPFQATVWMGSKVLTENPQVGQKVTIRTPHDEQPLEIFYAITAITIPTNAESIDSAISNLINTSVDDCKSSLSHHSDEEVLVCAWTIAKSQGKKSMAEAIHRRLKKVQREILKARSPKKGGGL